MKSYTETIQKMSRQAFDRHMQGSWDTMPDGVSIVAWIFDKDTATVLSDIEFHSNVLIHEQVKRVRQTA